MTRRRTLAWVALLVLAAGLALWCITVTVTRQRERDEATNAAVSLCRQVAGLGRRCSVDPTVLPWVGPAPSGQAVAPLPPPLVQPLPRKTPTAPGGADESVAADPVLPGPDAAVNGAQIAGGRLILTYTDGARVDVGPTDEILTLMLTRPSSSVSPSRPAPAPSATEGAAPTAGGVTPPLPSTPSGRPT